MRLPRRTSLSRPAARRTVAGILLSSLGLWGCASALRGSGPGPSLAAELGVNAQPGDPETAPALVEAAEASWSRRPNVASVREAARLWARSALAGGRDVEGLLGFARATAWLIEREAASAERERMATAAVRAGERCRERAPGSPTCEYALAMALGQQARERPSTALDGLKEMIASLGRAIEGDEQQDRAGPRRVLALVYLRAPGWPSGPGDPDAALPEAQRAVSLYPGHPPNQLVLGEALEKTGDPDGAVAAYQRARSLASSLSEGGDPDAADWLEEARQALSRLGS